MKTMFQVTLAVLVLALLPVEADILVPGYKRVVNEVIVDQVKGADNMALFTYSAGLSAPIEAGKPLQLGKGARFGAVSVVAIPTGMLASLGGQPQQSWFNHSGNNTQLPEGVVVSAEYLPYSQQIAATDPTERIITHLTITLISASRDQAPGAPRLIVHTVREERLDHSGRPVQPSTGRPTALFQGAGIDHVEVERASAPAIEWVGLPLLGLVGIGYLWTRKRTRL